MSFNTSLNRKGQVKRITVTQDAAGSRTEALAVVGPVAKCRILPLSLNEREVQGREAVIGTHLIRFKKKVDVQEDDEIWEDQTSYRVHTVTPRKRFNRIHHLSVEASVIDAQN